MSGAFKTDEPTVEEQCQQLTVVLENLEHDLNSKHTEFADITEEVAKMKSMIECKEVEQNTKRKELERQEKLYALLPDAPAHLERKKTLLKSNLGKMAELEEQWLEIKKPLDDDYKIWLSRHENVNLCADLCVCNFNIFFFDQSAGEKLKATLEKTVISLRNIVEEIRTKEDAIQKLQTHIESLPTSGLTRFIIFSINLTKEMVMYFCF